MASRRAPGSACCGPPRAWALLAGRDYCLPEDVQVVLPACLPHRLTDSGDGAGEVHEDIADYILAGVPVA